MDVDESGWILEFLLRQDSIDEQSLNDLLSVLPLPNNNTRLKKSLILRKIASDIQKGTISERTMEFLQQIEELDLREGNYEVSEAMKAAYCTVAMYCTAKSMEEKGGDKYKYPSSLKRIWSGRIREMEMSEVAMRVGLGQDELLRWMNDIDARVLNVDVCEHVFARFKAVDVAKVLRHFVNEAKEHMGPSFLELAFQKILSDREATKMLGFDEGAQHNYQNEDGAPTVNQDVDANANDNNKGNALIRAQVVPRQKHVAPKGAKIVDPMEMFHNTHDTISTPEVNRVEEDGDQNKRVKTNLMERDSTAHTVEWSDSSEIGSPSRRPHLPSPKKREVSPLSIYKSKKFPRRKNKWSILEEDTLRTGVQKYGKGNWKLILSQYRDIFENRIEVDLKDKWRNLSR